MPGRPCEGYLRPVDSALMKASTQTATPFHFKADHPTVTGTLVSADIHWVVVDAADGGNGLQRICIPRENVIAFTQK